jgi:hypothetical protein
MRCIGIGDRAQARKVGRAPSGDCRSRRPAQERKSGRMAPDFRSPIADAQTPSQRVTPDTVRDGSTLIAVNGGATLRI